MPGAIVFIDANNNGAFDTGEISVTSDANGNYPLPTLPNSSYRLGIVPPATYVYTGSELTLSLPLSTAWAGGTFTLNRSTSISGYVLDDQNGDNVSDVPAVPIVGATVWLDLNNNASLDSNEPSILTDVYGGYNLTAPSGGTFTVRTRTNGSFDTTAGSARSLTLNALPTTQRGEHC